MHVSCFMSCGTHVLAARLHQDTAQNMPVMLLTHKHVTNTPAPVSYVMLLIWYKLMA
jgi:hypothetical protein